MLVKCKNCGDEFEKTASAVRHTSNNFCSRSCAGVYNGKRRRGPYNGRAPQLTRACEMRSSGASYGEISRELGVSVFAVAKWVRDIKCPSSPRENLLRVCRDDPVPLEELIGAAAIRKRLIRLRGDKCQVCNSSDWNSKKLTIELHHIDGNHDNIDMANLQLLCPNCHSQTDNFRNKTRSGGTADAAHSKCATS